MLLDIRETDQPRAFRLIGELDMSNADTLAALLDREAQAEGDITLDLSELTFIDSSGIRVLLKAMESLNGKGMLVLFSPSSSVRHILLLMGLDEGDRIRVIDPAAQAGS
jgi:anti-sigma B factor antagonist